MKKHILGHIVFWIGLISLDVTGYIPIWQHSFGVSAIVNYSWLLLIFYTAYFTSLSFFRGEYLLRKFPRYIQFWIVAILPVIYIPGVMITDKYIIGYFEPVSIWTYCVSRFIMIYPFICNAIFLAGFQTKTIQFITTKKEVVKLHNEKEQLVKAINLLKFEKLAMQGRVNEIRNEYREKLEYYETIIQRLKNGDNDEE